MKKVLALTLALALILSLSACKSKDKDTEIEEEPQISDNVTDTDNNTDNVTDTNTDTDNRTPEEIEVDETITDSISTTVELDEHGEELLASIDNSGIENLITSLEELIEDDSTSYIWEYQITYNNDAAKQSNTASSLTLSFVYPSGKFVQYDGETEYIDMKMTVDKENGMKQLETSFGENYYVLNSTSTDSIMDLQTYTDAGFGTYNNPDPYRIKYINTNTLLTLPSLGVPLIGFDGLENATYETDELCGATYKATLSDSNVRALLGLMDDEETWTAEVVVDFTMLDNEAQTVVKVYLTGPNEERVTLSNIISFPHSEKVYLLINNGDFDSDNTVNYHR